jgi:OmpA-OmpF porin, OOP family
MTLRSVLLASALMALPMAAANAQAISGPYFGVGLGINYLQRETFNPPGLPSGNIKSDIGPAFAVSLGWGFGNGLRAEVEGDYLRNGGFSDASGFGGAVTSVSGNEQKIGAMVNVLYDFVGVMPVVQPYVGFGVGYQAEILQDVSLTTGGGTASVSNSTEGSFAYQGILGVAFPLEAHPGVALTAEYRFMGLAGHRNFSSSVGTLQSTDNYNHSFLVGFRYAFNAAPPPPPPMPAVAEMGAKTFLVFFDWDRADLTPRAEGIVHDAAAYSTTSKYTRIDVDGNTDTSGSPAYNQGLSERRARVVAAELVRDGVPQNAIDMHAYGDTKLLVPTGPGVREPQNRRVEIVFH